jgi:hypothetical protein
MTPQVGARFGAWALVSVDATGKRALCCCICGTVTTVAVDALTAGQSAGCGCRSTPRLSSSYPAKPSAFARDIALLERTATQARAKGKPTNSLER